MSDRFEVADMALLLAESRWLSALARRLVTDGLDADDLAQDTLVTALAHPPETDRPIRGWLATVLRGRLSDRRREARARFVREQLGARDEALPPTADVVAKAEQQRLLVDALLALDEPYRTTVLLRFFEDLPPRAIARRMQVPVATVNSRLQRALVKLRDALDRSHGRKSWLSALVPLAGEPRSLLPWIPGVSIVNGTMKAGLATAAVAALLCAWLWTGDDGTRAEPEHGTAVLPAIAEPGLQRTSDPRSLQSSAEPLPREQLAGAELPGVAAAELPPAEVPPALRGRVIDVLGRGIAGVQLGWEPATSETASTEDLVSGADGRFELPVPRAATAIASVDPRWSTILSGAARIDRANEARVLIAPRLDLGGHAVDEHGQALGDVEISVHVPRHLGADLGILFDFSIARSWRTRSDAEGRFALDDVPFVERGALHGSLSGYVTRVEPLAPVPNGSLLLVLERPRSAEGFVRGVVLDPAGSPVPGARVSAGAEVASTDERGEFALAIEGRELLPRIVALARGFQPAVLEPESVAGAPRWPARVVLTLGPPPLAIEGRVLDADRAPRAGVRVWIVDPLCIGHADGDVVLAESFLGGDPTRFWDFATTDSDGRFALRGLRERPYSIAAIDPRTLARADAERVAAGKSGVELVLGSELLEHLRGRVVARDGTGIAGVSVKFQRPVLEVAVPGGTRDEWHDSEPVTTGADGTFELTDLPREGVEIFAWGDAILFAGRMLTKEADPEHFDITVDRRVHLQVELDPPTDRADALQVLDERGQPMILRVMRGETSYTSRKATIEGGRSQVLSLGEGARAVVFLRVGVEVGRLPARLEPGGIRTLRW